MRSLAGGEQQDAESTDAEEGGANEFRFHMDICVQVLSLLWVQGGMIPPGNGLADPGHGMACSGAVHGHNESVDLLISGQQGAEQHREPDVWCGGGALHQGRPSRAAVFPY